MNKRHYEHTLPNIRGSLSNTYHWEGFAAMYRKELENSEAALRFIDTIKHHHTITLLYASKAPIYNHARILQRFLQEHLD